MSEALPEYGLVKSCVCTTDGIYFNTVTSQPPHNVEVRVQIILVLHGTYLNL